MKVLCRLLRVVIGAAGIVLLLLSCATNPVTRQPEFVLMSEDQEITIGREMDPKILQEYGMYNSEHLQQYVKTIGKRLAAVSDRRDLFFHFTVVDTPLVNAFALPGGYVYVTRGLLAYVNSDAELAGVLGHEIGHVTARHAVRQYTKAASYNIATNIASIFVPQITNFGQVADIAFVAITSGYSREYEREADRLGVKYAFTAGYDPKAIASFLQTLALLDKVEGKKSYHGLFSTHPQTEERVTLADAAADIKTLPRNTPLVIGKENCLKQIDGLLFGPDPKEGVIRGDKFQHPDLKIELSFPRGWNIENKPDAVIAKNPAQKEYLQLMLEHLNKKTSITDVARNISRKTGFTESAGNATRINGLDAYVGTYSGKTQKLGYITARIGFIQDEDIVHFIIGYSRPEQFSAALPSFNATINSFKKLSVNEAQVIKPSRIRLYTVKAGDTFNSICKEFGRPADEAKTLALLNGMNPSRLTSISSVESSSPQSARAELQPGTVIKVIKNE
jgi:predicted Zn-dependent protease